MHKKTLYSIIIIAGFVLGFIAAVIINVTLLARYDHAVYDSFSISLLITREFLNYLLTIPFFIIILLYFKEDKTLIYFSILIIVGRFFGTLDTSLSMFLDDSGFITLLESISAFASVGTIFFAIRLFYKDKFKKRFIYCMIYISVVYFLLESGVSGFYVYLMYLFIGGNAIRIFFVLLYLGVLIVEVISIRYLYDFYRNYKEKPKTEIVYAMDALKIMREERALKEKEGQ